MSRRFTIILFVFVTIYGSAQVTMQKAEGGLLFVEKNQNVLFYQSEPKNLDGEYERCNYIHPLWADDGTILTEDFPIDHLHQRGIFWAWHQILINGQRIGDGWEIKNFEQEVTEVEYLQNKEGSAILNTKVYWKSDLWKKEGKKIPYIQENTTITIHPKTGNYRKIDFVIRLLALEKNVEIGGSEDEKGYSGFSVRMTLPDDVLFDGPDGKVEPQNEAVRSPGYINISGSMLKNDKFGGIAILDKPENPGYPQPWILRAKNSMQNAVYPGNRTVPVSTIDPLILRYSLLVYSGKMGQKRIQRIQQN